ncbi:hypothetical protein BO82DRAFT_205503 [Aspergillus uvarum CBS 121591]|uniref:Uncharacterized protein n=1 Tax=Aspergillus uvarum CBS 121591 TaxID=1448315 RepID=A0A319BUX6_9EURO|nr:hypothetical protein BO82DRAFT_205503 [Aspergillus uvarum CBS 121591]PYH76404.1 hypothetical protein BO82DRAFT_205503 [Aspergillus uvarum CBS 121591]
MAPNNLNQPDTESSDKTNSSTIYNRQVSVFRLALEGEIEGFRIFERECLYSSGRVAVVEMGYSVCNKAAQFDVWLTSQEQEWLISYCKQEHCSFRVVKNQLERGNPLFDAYGLEFAKHIVKKSYLNYLQATVVSPLRFQMVEELKTMGIKIEMRLRHRVDTWS